MDYFNEVLTAFLGLDCVSCVGVYGGSENSDFIKNILNFVLKMNEGLKGLERHEASN